MEDKLLGLLVLISFLLRNLVTCKGLLKQKNRTLELLFPIFQWWIEQLGANLTKDDCLFELDDALSSLRLESNLSLGDFKLLAN